MKILVTGAAGFIGYHLCENLVSQGHEIIALDNINNYYDINLKLSRLRNLGICIHQGYSFNSMIKSEKHSTKLKFIRLHIEDTDALSTLFEIEKFDLVCNLAAQAGVRYSLINPMAYVESNIVGFMNILECCRKYKVKKLIYASSSSVYGLNMKIPFSTKENVDQPISIYAATKKSNELMAYTYSHLYGIQTIGLRFFTVYGPWGRPDMAIFLFSDAILNNKPIKVFNHGELYRDFTYIDDIICGLSAVIEKDNGLPYKIYNIGNSKPIKLLDFIAAIEYCTGKIAIKELVPMQPGDVFKTWANVEDLKMDFNYQPNVNIDVGIRNFIAWYKNYYEMNYDKTDILTSI